MAKKSSSKPQQMLSPENYIRKKARNLPIDKCYINSNWQQDGLAQIVVARKHASGNYTHGFYLVDLYCLGVRDSFYYYNTNNYEFEELINDMSRGVKMIPVEYPLVHNIIYAALEYADELGFKPHKVFTATSRFILEEDTEDVELIEIECGLHGKPTFIRSESFTDAQANIILNQLEKAVGPGNFKFIVPGTYNDDEEFEDDGEGEWDEEWDDDKWSDENDEFDESGPEYQQLLVYENMTPANRKKLFLDLYAKDVTTLGSEELKEITMVAESIYLNDVTEDEKVDEYYGQCFYEIDKVIFSHDYSPEILGVEPHQFSESELKELSQDIHQLKAKKKYLKKDIRSLEKKWGKVPMLCYFELLISSEKEFDKLLASYFDSYGSYVLFQLAAIEKRLNDDETIEPLVFTEIFANRIVVSDVEMRKFQQLKILIMTSSGDINDLLCKLEAQSMVIEELELFDDDLVVLRSLLTLVKIHVLYNFFMSRGGNESTVPNAKDQKPTPTRASRTATSDNNEPATTLQLTIELQHLNSLEVWRKIQISSDASFDEFHNAIQLAFGWQNEHLYQFSPQGYGSTPIIEKNDPNYVDPFMDDQVERLDAEAVTLSEIFTEEGQTYTYIYDFGDSWEHQITLEDIFQKSIQTPLLMDGEGACPPENCGGSGGYEDLLAILNDKNDPSYSETRSWLGLKRGQKWDPYHFDIEKSKKLF